VEFCHCALLQRLRPRNPGRVFTERDDAAAAQVVVINQAMAKQFWKNEDPIGQRLII
jgi:putative ABC transport system permease protein